MVTMALKSQKNIESYPYSVIESHENFEIRMYESALFTSVTLNDSTYKEASGKGFSILAGYIFGDNERDQKISMTSPVAMSLEDSITMMFMVPKELKKDSLPRPSERAIEFVEAPPRKVAAISFGGWANDRKIKKYRELLVRSLEKKALNTRPGSPFWDTTLRLNCSTAAMRSLWNFRESRGAARRITEHLHC